MSDAKCCDATKDVWCCTLAAGHMGKHIASTQANGEGTICATWDAAPSERPAGGEMPDAKLALEAADEYERRADRLDSDPDNTSAMGLHFVRIAAALRRLASRSSPSAPPHEILPAFDYPAAARSLHLNLAEFCDESLTFPAMIAEAGRRARAEIERLRLSPPSAPDAPNVSGNASYQAGFKAGWAEAFDLHRTARASRAETPSPRPSSGGGDNA